NPHGPISGVVKQGLAMHKQWMLINPANYLGYNFRNAVSDADILLTRYPGAFTEVAGAMRDLRNYSKKLNDIELTQQIHDRIADGTISGGQTFYEIPEVGNLS